MYLLVHFSKMRRFQLPGRLFFTPGYWYKQSKKCMCLSREIQSLFSKHIWKFQTMNYFSKDRLSQPSTRGQVLLLDPPSLEQPSPVARDSISMQATASSLPHRGMQLVYWIERLPREVLDSHPRLSLLYIQALLFTQQFERAQRYLRLIEYNLRFWESDEKESIQAELLTLRTFLNMHLELTAHYRETFDDLVHFVTRTNTGSDFLPDPEPEPYDCEFAMILDPLSKRELEVLGYIAAGMSNQEIAQTIFVAVGTVKRHINNIYNKLNVHSRIQAVRYAQKHRLLPV